MSFLKAISCLRKMESRRMMRSANVMKWMPVFVLSLLALSGCKKDKTEMYQLTVSVSPSTEVGTVTISPEAKEEYEEGTTLSLLAEPASGYYFAQWNGDASGQDTIVEVIMDDDKSVEAVFEPGAYEGFSNGEADNFVDDESGCWAVSDTSYVMTGTGSGDRLFSYFDDEFTDFELSVDVTAIGENTDLSSAFGFVFRSQSATDIYANAYRLAVSGNGSWYLGVFVDGSLSFDGWVSSENLNTGLGSTNNIKVVCSGSSIEVIFNGVSEGTYTYTNFSSGYIAIYGYDSSGYTNTFVFDNFLVKELTSTKSTVTGLVQSQVFGDCEDNPDLAPAGL